VHIHSRGVWSRYPTHYQQHVHGGGPNIWPSINIAFQRTLIAQPSINLWKVVNACTLST
jgi:hypothetical protein